MPLLMFEDMYFTILGTYLVTEPRFVTSVTVFTLMHSRSQSPRSFWSAPGIETSGSTRHLYAMSLNSMHRVGT